MNLIRKEKALRVHELLDESYHPSAIAFTLGISRDTVKNIKAGVCWKREQL